jgi:formate dehydrogenase major subunit
MGSSMAENHSVGFQWVIEARERGAKIIHVDPRFTRTSAMADIWVPLRAGSDVLFLGGLINYVLEHGKEFREYVAAYTNASTLLRDDFRDTEDLDGLFSGWDAEKKKYDPESWAYRGSSSTKGGIKRMRRQATLPQRAGMAKIAAEKLKMQAGFNPIVRCKIHNASFRY